MGRSNGTNNDLRGQVRNALRELSDGNGNSWIGYTGNGDTYLHDSPYYCYGWFGGYYNYSNFEVNHGSLY